MKIPRRFRDVEQASYVLIGFIPYLLALYLVVSQDIEVTASVLGVAALALVAHLIGFSVIRKFGRHLKTVRDSTGKALSSKLRTTIEVEKDTPDELSDIVNSFNVMLRESQQAARNFQEMTTKMMLYSRDIEKYQKRLREEGLSRHRLSRYVGQDLVNKIVNSNEETPLQNKRQMATILFADIRSFTTISEDMEPETLINMLNEYFDAMVNIIFKHYGVLDKFVGDELMATFGLLDSVENGPINSLKAAIEMQNSMKSLMGGFKKKGYPVFEIGIGINCGDVVMGNLGSKNRMDYTVIGDTVNVAARLEQMAGGGDIIAGEAVHDRCGHLVTMRPKGAIQVKNRVQPVQCYQVMT